MSLTRVELDRLAKDTGCAVHNDCLTCPLPECVYDVKGLYAKTERRRITIRQKLGYLSVKDVAKQLGVCVRTVERAREER